MLKRTAISALTLAALAVAPGAAHAADTVVVPGAVAQHMTALDGVVVWTTANQSRSTLMQRDAGGTVGPVLGAPKGSYASIDLGHDVNGDLVLTYLRCTATRNCTAYSDDLNGHRTTFKQLVPTRCELTAAPSRWRNRVAYGLRCSKLGGKPDVFDAKRSGLFVRNGAGAAKRVGLPPRSQEDPAVADNGRWVDLRATSVSASASGLNLSGAYTQTVDGRHRRVVGRGTDEGAPGVSLESLSLGAGGSLWTLYHQEVAEGPYEAIVSRLRSGCEDHEVLTNPAGPNEQGSYPARSMAVDANTIYLYVPGTGIVTHEFVPISACNR